MNSAQRQEVAAMEMRERKRVTDLLARAEREELDSAWEQLAEKPVVQPVRGPETGLVMVRGRIGGGGSPFNLGEDTVTRTTIRLASGKVGHGHALGTDKECSRLAAIFADRAVSWAFSAASFAFISYSPDVIFASFALNSGDDTYSVALRALTIASSIFAS